MKYVLLALGMLCSIASVNAGEVRLKTGDRIGGELVRLDGDNMVWKSESFGEMRIKKNLIASVQTDTSIKIDGHTQPCRITNMRYGRIEFECEDGAVGEVPLVSLRQMLPYPTYASGYYLYRGKLVLSGRLKSGNTSEKNWAADTETVFRRGDFRHEMDIEYYGVSVNDEAADDRADWRYGLDWFFKERWYWYNDVQAGFDQAADIDERYIYGSGFGFQIFDTDENALSIETGLSYVKEHFTEPETFSPDFSPSNETSAWRWALNYRSSLPGTAKFFHNHQLIRSLEDSYDWTLQTDTGISIPLTGTLYAEIKIDYDVDNFPAEGVRREDTQLSVGVGYSWQ